MENKFFVGLQRAPDFRRSLLETSRSTVHALKKFYTIQQLREDKLAVSSQLKKEIKELNLLLKKLEGMLPEHEIYTKKKETKKGSPKKKGAKKTVKKSKKLTPVEKLQQSLSEIERKLSSI